MCIIFFLFKKSNSNNGEYSQQRDCPEQRSDPSSGVVGCLGPLRGMSVGILGSRSGSGAAVRKAGH